MVALTMNNLRGDGYASVVLSDVRPSVSIEATSLCVRYGQTPALQDVSFQIRTGEYVIVTGPSGCGKSTLALTLVGLIPQSIPAKVQGRLRVAGLDPTITPAPLMARVAGIVFQNPATQLFNATVEEEVTFGPRVFGMPAAEISRRVEEAMDAVRISHLRTRSVRDLSGGEKQRVAIAAVLALGSQVLILDEPTANLDRHGAMLVAESLRQLNRDQNITILLLEHRLHPFIADAGRVLLLENGRLAADGSPHSVLSDDALLRRLGLRNPWYPVGPRFSALPPSGITHRPHGKGLVAVEDVSFYRQGTVILKDIDLALLPGEFVALIGDNGSGKTTLAMLLAGALRPTRGRIRWHDRNDTKPTRPRVGLLFQNPREQFLCESVREEVEFGPANLGFDVPSAVKPVLEATDLTALWHRHPLTLSVGQQQRAALAACVSASPQLLILDEPTMGQDWGHLERMMNYLRQLHAEGQTILLISHDEKLVYHYATRIIIMQGGQIVADGAPRPVTNQRKSSANTSSLARFGLNPPTLRKEF